MTAVVEQLEKVVEVIAENPEKSIGLRLTSIVEHHAESSPLAAATAATRRPPMEVQRPMALVPSAETAADATTATLPTPAAAAAVRAGGRFSVAKVADIASPSDESATEPTMAIVGVGHEPSPTSLAVQPIEHKVSRFRVQAVHQPSLQSQNSIEMSAVASASTLTAAAATAAPSATTTTNIVSQQQPSQPPSSAAGVSSGAPSAHSTFSRNGAEVASTLQMLDSELRKVSGVTTSTVAPVAADS